MNMADYYTKKMAELLKQRGLKTKPAELLPADWKDKWFKNSQKGAMLFYKKGELKNPPDKFKVQSYLTSKKFKATSSALDFFSDIIDDNKTIANYDKDIAEDKLKSLNLKEYENLTMTVQEYNTFMKSGKVPEGKITDDDLWQKILLSKKAQEA